MKFNKMKTIRSKFKFLYILLVIGIFLGLILYLKSNQEVKLNIDLTLASCLSNIKDTHQNQILIHLLIISLIIISSCFIIGVIPLIIYYLYETTSIGFLLASFIHYKKIKGIYYAIIFILTNKSLHLILLSYLLYITFKHLKNFINNNYKIINLNNYLLKCFIILILILLNDIFLYYYGNLIINFLI